MEDSMAGMVSAAEGAILKGANTVATTRQELDGRIKQVESQILAIGSNWQGSAAVAFQALMVRWNEGHPQGQQRAHPVRGEPA